MNTLSNQEDRQSIAKRVASLTPNDRGRWGVMNVHQMVCHLDDAYKVALGQKTARAASGSVPRTVMKWFALSAPMKWPKGVPTLPEVEQGKGGSPPVEFNQDLAALHNTFDRFCAGLPSPLPGHAIFGSMTLKDWMRWGYLHADHHLRQFGR